MEARAALREAVVLLRAAGVPDPGRDGRKLLAEVTEGDVLTGEESARFEALVAERATRRPMAQILGRRAFWRHEFEVTPDVLDPRPETETLVEAALEVPFTRVLDLGTGSGAILLSLLAERPDADGVGTDLSEAALAIAQRNGQRLGITAAWHCGNWFEGLGAEAPFDLIVSNPPYIAQVEMAGLGPELGFEPHMALTDGADGLEAYRAIAKGAPKFLRPGGHLMVEHGVGQSEAIQGIFRDGGLGSLRARADLSGRPRVVCAQFPA